MSHITYYFNGLLNFSINYISKNFLITLFTVIAHLFLYLAGLYMPTYPHMSLCERPGNDYLVNEKIPHVRCPRRFECGVTQWVFPSKHCERCNQLC